MEKKANGEKIGKKEEKVSIRPNLTRDDVQNPFDLSQDEPVVGPWTLGLLLFLVVGSGKYPLTLTQLHSPLRINPDCHILIRTQRKMI